MAALFPPLLFGCSPIGCFFLVWREHVDLIVCPSTRVQCETTRRASRAGDLHLGAGLKGSAVCGEVGARLGAVVAMRMCVMMHCAMAFWWGCSLGALSLLFVCEVPLVLLRDL